MSATGRARLLFIAFLGMMAWIAVMGGDAASAAKPELSVIGDSVNLKTATGKDSKASAITILNAGSVAATVTVALQASSEPQVALSKPTGAVRAAPGATRIPVEFRGLKDLPRKIVHAQLVLRGGAKPIAQSVTITPARNPSANWPQWFAIGSGITFVLLLVIAGVSASVLQHQPESPWKGKGLQVLTSHAPGLDWQATGWISNLTAVGALLGATLAAVTFPDAPREIDKETLIAMNIVFGALLAIGPFVFQSVRRRHVADSPLDLQGKGLEKPGLWGWKSILVGSYSLTTVAVFGQLAALTLLGWELTHASTAVSYGIVILAVALAVLAVFYFEAMVNAQWRADWLGKARNEEKAEDAEEPLKKKHFPLHVQFGGTWPEVLEIEARPQQADGDKAAAGNDWVPLSHRL